MRDPLRSSYCPPLKKQLKIRRKPPLCPVLSKTIHKGCRHRKDVLRAPTIRHVLVRCDGNQILLLSPCPYVRSVTSRICSIITSSAVRSINASAMVVLNSSSCVRSMRGNDELVSGFASCDGGSWENGSTLEARTGDPEAIFCGTT